LTESFFDIVRSRLIGHIHGRVSLQPPNWDCSGWFLVAQPGVASLPQIEFHAIRERVFVRVMGHRFEKATGHVEQSEVNGKLARMR